MFNNIWENETKDWLIQRHFKVEYNFSIIFDQFPIKFLSEEGKLDWYLEFVNLKNQQKSNFCEMPSD